MFEPIRLSTEGTAPVNRAPLFYIDDVEVTVPERFSASFALRYVDVVTKRGLDAATAWLLENALSPGGYEALMGYEALEPEHLGAIVSRLQEMVIGAMESPKGAKLKSA